MDGSGSLVELEEPIGDAISRIRFAPRSDNLLISSWDTVLRLYDVDQSVLRSRALSEAALLDCCFEDESTALSAGSDGCIRRYDFCSGTETIIGKHDASSTCIEYSQETGQVVTAGLDKNLMFWDTNMRNQNGRYTEVVDSDIWSISVCQLYLLAAVGKRINVYDLRSLREPVQIRESAMGYQIRCVRPFSNCEGYVIGLVDGCVELKYFDPTKESEMGCAFRCHPKSKNGKYHLVSVNDIQFHPHYGTFVTGDNEGYALVWDAQSRKRLFELQRYPSSVASISYDQTGQFLAVASSYTYQEANEVVEAPQIFIHAMDMLAKPSVLRL